jgi:hypothetical protein
MTNTGSAVEPHVPAGAAPAALDFGEMLRRAKVLANTELVPKPLQGKPEAIVLVGALGAELGVPFVASLSDIHVIEGRPSPSAQLRLALIRRAGHDARFVETSSTKAIIEGRRADSDRWTRVEWTIDDARRAGLLDRWVEQWKSSSGGKRYAEKVTVGDDSGIFTDEERARRALGPLPEWATKAVVKAKDNWVKYPAEMLRARAASALCRMEFSDVLAGLGMVDHTPEELGVDLGQDVDEPPVEVDDERVEPGPGDGSTDVEQDDEIVLCSEGVEGCDVDGAHQHAADEPSSPTDATPPDASPGPESDATPADDPITWSGDRWREVLKDRDIKIVPVLKHARELAGGRGEELPSSIDELEGRELARDVLAYVEAIA